MRGIGVRQRAILTAMARHGGVWPADWKIRYDERAVFDSLERRGAIERVDAVTPFDRDFTYQFTTEPQRERERVY
jgi:hypothetical protein